MEMRGEDGAAADAVMQSFQHRPGDSQPIPGGGAAPDLIQHHQGLRAGQVQYRRGFGSSTAQAPRAPVISETQRLINAKSAQDRVLVQNHLRYQFFDPSSRCKCNPENDRLYLEVRLKETFAKIPKPKDVSADLKILDDLLSRGVLTHDQHDAARRKLLT